MNKLKIKNLKMQLNSFSMQHVDTPNFGIEFSFISKSKKKYNIPYRTDIMNSKMGEEKSRGVWGKNKSIHYQCCVKAVAVLPFI